MKKYISKNNLTMIKQTGHPTPGTSVEKVHLGCRLNVALGILRKLLRSLRNTGPSVDHCLTINMPKRRHTKYA